MSSRDQSKVRKQLNEILPAKRSSAFPHPGIEFELCLASVYAHSYKFFFRKFHFDAVYRCRCSKTFTQLSLKLHREFPFATRYRPRRRLYSTPPRERLSERKRKSEKEKKIVVRRFRGPSRVSRVGFNLDATSCGHRARVNTFPRGSARKSRGFPHGGGRGGCAHTSTQKSRVSSGFAASSIEGRRDSK